MGLPLGPIQTLPAGLTGLLQLKTLGRVPDELAGFVQPTADVLRLWLNDQARTNGATIHGLTVTTGGGGLLLFSPNAITVPDNEWWFVHEYMVSAVFTAAAGQQVDHLAPAIAYNLLGTINWAPLVPGQSFSSVATQPVAGAVVARDFWANPGAGLGFSHSQIVSVPGIGFTGRYRITRLRI